MSDSNGQVLSGFYACNGTAALERNESESSDTFEEELTLIMQDSDLEEDAFCIGDDVNYSDLDAQIYTDWANHYLEKARNKRSITDLQQDVSDGVLLADVIEAVTNEKVRDIKTKPRNATQMVENINACLSYLASLGVSTEGISAKDIREGNLKAILGLFFSLSRYKQQQKQAAAANLSNARNGTIVNNVNQTTESKLPLLNKQSRCPTVPNPSSKDQASQQQTSNLNRKSFSFNAADRTKNLNQQNNNLSFSSGSVPRPGSHQSRDSATSASSRSTSPSASRQTGIPTPGSRLAAATRSRSPTGTRSVGRSQSLSDKSAHRINNSTSTSSASSGKTNSSATSASRGTTGTTSGYTSSASSTAISNRTATNNKNSMLDKFKFFGSKEKCAKQGTLPKSGASAKDSKPEPQLSPKSKKKLIGSSKKPKEVKDEPQRPESRLRPVTPPANAGHLIQRSTTPPATYGRTIQRPVTPPASYGRQVVQPTQPKSRQPSPQSLRRNGGIPKSDSKTDLKNQTRAKAPPPTTLGSGVTKQASTGLNSPNTAVPLPNTGIPKPGSKPVSSKPIGKEEKRLKELKRSQTPTRNGNGNYDQVYEPSGGHYSDQSQSLKLSRDTSEAQAIARGQRSLDRNANLATKNNQSASRKYSPTDETYQSLPKKKVSGSTQTTTSSSLHNGSPRRKLPSPPQEKKSPIVEDKKLVKAVSENNSSSKSDSSTGTVVNSKYVKTQPAKKAETTAVESSNEKTHNQESSNQENKRENEEEQNNMEVKPMAPLQRPSPYAYLPRLPSGQPQPAGAQRQPQQQQQPGPLMSQYGSSQRLRTMMANGQYLTSMKHGGSASAMSSDDYASDCDLDLATGYMSDGDILRKNQPEDYSGYMSEGGASMYARKMQQKFREGMMQAVEECMRKSNNLVDDDSFDDSSSISSGDISDTIGDISTDENLGSTHSAADYNRTPRQDYSSAIYTSPKRGPVTNATAQSQQSLAARNYTGYDYTAWRKSSSTAPSEGGDGNYMHLDYSSEPDTSTLNSWRKRGQQQQQPDYKPGYYATSSLRRNSDYAQHQLSSTENLIGGNPGGNKQQRCPPPADSDSMIIMRKSNQQPVATGMPMSTFGYRRPTSTSSANGDCPPCPPTRSLNGKPPVQKRTGRSDYENIYTTPDGSPRRIATQQQSDPTSQASSDQQRRNYNNQQEDSPRRSMVGSKTQTFTSTQEQIDDAYKSNTLGRRRPGQQSHHQMPIYGSGTNLQKAFSQDKLLSSIYGNPQAMYASIRYNAQGERSRSMSIPNSIPNPTNPQTWLNGESTENLTTAEKIQQARAIAKGYRDSLNMEKMNLEHTHKRSQSQSLDQNPRSSCNQLYSAPVSPTPSTQSASRFTYPMTALSPSHVAKSTSNQSLARSSSQQGMPYMMSKSVSRDEDFHGSSISLASSSSLYSTPNEEKQAAEIRKLRRELESAQEKVATLTSQLSTNAHVVSAFEQSLSNMTSRLQSLTSSSHQKDSELNELKETIESLRLQSGGIRIDPNSLQSAHRRISAPAPPTPISAYSSPEHCLLSSPGPLTRQLSTESMSSVNSMSSACSMTSQQSAAGSKDKGDRKNKGGWLRSSFSKAFSKQKKNRKGSMSDVEGDSVSISSDISVPNSPLLMTSSNMASTLPGAYSSMPSTPMNGIKQSHSESRLTEDADSVQRLQVKLQEKDMKLTDIQLEALSSAHQLETLRETMIKMKNEMSTLKADNERLQKMVVTKSSNPTSPEHSMKRTSLDDLDKSYLLQEHASNIDLLLNDTSTDGRRVLISVYLGNDTDISSLVKASSPEVLIGSMCVTGKIRWDMLDSIIRRYFKDYCIKVDPACHLGLNSESVYSYHIGDIVRTKDAAETPELLPCGYLVGEDMQIKIVLKGTEQQAIDSLAFETLIPKSIIQRYISLLVEHRRIILCGPSGTGKTYLAHKLAEFLVRRSGRPLDASAISTFSVEHKSSKELRQYLASIAEQCQNESRGNETLPCVIILDNLHHVGSLSEVFDGFLSCKYQKSPYIIGTMNQATCSTTNLQLHHNFRWVLCANHMEPVKGFLGRFLKRKLIEAELRTGRRDLDLNKMVDWMPQVWQKLNKFLETHSSSDVTVGPRLFLSCPMDISGSQVWFTDLYNYSLVPYLMDATREGLQLYGRRATWEDPAEWVMQHYPWPSPDTQDNPALLRIRPEDVGYDQQTMATPGTPSSKTQPTNHTQENDQDPLLNMLMRLQEAASYSSPQSADSDSQSQEEGKTQESTII